MMSGVEWIYLAVILAITLAGAYYPFFKPEEARTLVGFPVGEAFSSGVFLGLSLLMMLPASSGLFGKLLPDFNFPTGAFVALVAFLALLAVEQISMHKQGHPNTAEAPRVPASVPAMMALMIAFPSFFLGMTLGLSESYVALLIFLAIILHKGTAAFALMLAMVRSELSRRQTILLFSGFALSTPLGIIAGNVAVTQIGSAAMIIKASVLGLAAGTFLFMGTLHELQHTPLIKHCCRPRCFVAMFVGLAITGFVRFVVGEAHSL